MMQQTLVVIGGGAAGFFCAINAAEKNAHLKVIIVEKTNKVLSKVKVSGGGRCNVTHQCFDINELIQKYPRGKNFLKKAFHWFNPQHTINWFKEKGIALKAEEDGRIFPVTNNSQTIIDCFLQAAHKNNIEISINTEVTAVKVDNIFELQTNKGTIQANYVCIAAGGYPKQLQFKWIEDIRHLVESPVPSLFTFNLPKHPITTLMGISVPQVQVKIQGTKHYSNGPLLITHWGFSGPAILKLSALAAKDLASCNYNFTITINWLNTVTENELREQWPSIRNKLAQQLIHKNNPFNLPARLWLFLVEQAQINSSTNWASITQKQQNSLIQLLTNNTYHVIGKTTFKEEFVTCGGVKLNQVDVNTMQSKIIPHLYFAGEVLDIDGITGGFNFQNAWTTAYLAANSIAKVSNIKN